MKFSDWEKELEELHKRTKPLLVDEDVLGETFRVGKEEVKVFLGDEIIIHTGGSRMEGSYNLRHLYSSRDKVWAEVLGDFKTKVTLAEALNKKLVGEMVKPFMKEAVLDRLTGTDEDIDDNEVILQKCAAKRISKLEKMLPKSPIYNSMEWPLPSPSENFQLKVTFRRHIAEVTYGEGGLKSIWSLLQNYEKVEEVIKKFGILIAPAFALSESARKE